MNGSMDETTGQGTSKLPRRLPKQPNQVFSPEESRAVAEAPAPKRFVAEEFVPVFEMEPDVPASVWPDFPPQEFVLPEEESHVSHEFFADDQFFPVPEFIAHDEPLPPPQALPPSQVPTPPLREFVAAVRTPEPLAAPPALPPAPSQEPLDKRNQRDSPAVDSKPSVVPVGDPKPAFARPSGPSRSRPSRPSGSIASARLSGSYATPDASKSTYVGDDQSRFGELNSVSPAIVEAGFRASGHVSTADDASPAASPSRVTHPARSRRTSVKTVPALIVLSILLVGYSFAVGPIESYLESHLIDSSGPSGTLISLVPWVSLIPVVLLLGGVLWIIAGLIGLRHVKPSASRSRAGDTVAGRKRKKERRKAPLELFREEAANEEIDGDSAYQVWRLLQPFGPDSHVLSVHDELEETLSMSPKDIQSVYQQLVPEELRGERFHLHTVLDLLRVVKQASLSRASVRSRVS